jgi:hypothetical protein
LLLQLSRCCNQCRTWQTPREQQEKQEANGKPRGWNRA